MCCSVSPFCPPVTRRRCGRSRFSRFFSAPGSTPQTYPSMVPDPAKRIRLDVVPVISSWRRFLVSWAVCPQSLCRVLSARRETAPRVGLPGVCPVCLLGCLRSPGDGLPPPWTKRNAQKNFFKKFVFFALASTAGLKIPSQYLEHFPEVPPLSLSRGGVLSSGRRVALAACSQLWSCHARSFGYCLPERERLVHELRPGLLRCSCH